MLFFSQKVPIWRENIHIFSRQIDTFGEKNFSYQSTVILVRKLFLAKILIWQGK
jgi:hypothetical protein